MQMSIDEAVNIIRNYDIFGCGYCHQGGNEVEEAFGMAVDIMRKYQKIEEIVTQWQNETDPKIKFARSNIEKIKEVIEYGNVD